MVIRTTLWQMEPHTKIKHDILRRYLNAWIPILHKYKTINYIDGFAGPGIYSRGEEGSPLIAIKSICSHKLKPLMGSLKMNFLFIEKDSNRFESLEAEVNNFKISKCPQCNIRCNTKTVCGEFVNTTNEIFDFLDKNNSKIAPTFVFIDPFGFSGIPLKTIKKIMAYPHCEILITFMYDEISRFFNNVTNEMHLNSLFETGEWKDILGNKNNNSQDKPWLLKELYQKQLKNFAGITFIRSFLMINQYNKPDYFLFFGTNNSLGLIKMKESMRRSDGAGGYIFSDITYDPDQTTLFNPIPNYNKLKEIILEKYKGQKVPIEDIITFVNLETNFIEVDLRKPILLPLEKNNEIDVLYNKNTNRRRAGTYPKGTIIEFKQ